MTSLSNGGLGTWGVDGKDNIYYLSSKNQWIKTQGKLEEISVGGSQVWGVNSKYQIWYSTTVSTKPHWRRVSGALKQVSASAHNAVWGVNKEKRVWYYLGNNKWKHVKGLIHY